MSKPVFHTLSQAPSSCVCNVKSSLLPVLCVLEVDVRLVDSSQPLGEVPLVLRLLRLQVTTLVNGLEPLAIGNALHLGPDEV